MAASQTPLPFLCQDLGPLSYKAFARKNVLKPSDQRYSKGLKTV